MAEPMRIAEAQVDQAPVTQEAQSLEADDGTPEASALVAVRCICCGGDMVRDQLPRFSRGFGILVVVIGLLMSVMGMPLLGLPLVVIGAYLAVAIRSVWTCGECGAVVDRHGV